MIQRRMQTMLFMIVVSCASAMPAMPAMAQGASATGATAWPKADPKDVASPEAIVAALYDVISGPPGPRNWDRFRSLFTPDGRLIPMGADAQGRGRIRVMSPAEYAQRSDSVMSRNGFFEHEIANTTEHFGVMTHVFSTYESRHAKADATPFARGINSILLYNDGTRWWVVTVAWDAERANNPIPAKYLPPKP